MNKDLALLLLRLVAGAGIAYHGYGILFIGRLSGFIDAVAQMGFPVPLFFGWTAALSQFLGGILVALGLRTRIAAALICITMICAFFIAHKADPFHQKELAMMYMVVAGSLVLSGAGKYSLDRN